MTDVINDGGPAFALPQSPYSSGQRGMSLREHYAGLAMQAAVTGHAMAQIPYSYRECAIMACEQADALIAALKAGA